MLPDVSEMDIVNQATLDELMPRKKDGLPLLKRLFQIYLDETPRLLEELEKTVAAKDSEACYDVIHQMKGSAAAMGANRLFTITEAALHYCREGRLFEIENLVESIESESDLYVSHMAAILGGDLA